MAKPSIIIPDLKNKSSKRFNEKLRELSDKKVSSIERERIFSLVTKVLAKKK